MVFINLCPKIGVSQDTIAPKERVVWHKLEGGLSMTINQLGMTYWAAGGESNMSGKITGNFKHTYHRRMFNYVTSGLFIYGAQGYTRTGRYEKTEDRMEVSLTMTQNNKKNLTFTAMTMLKTQFTNGYSYPNDSIPISKFFAPAYLTVSIGYTYNIHDIVSIYFSPSAGKFTFVNDQTLADKGSFGVEAGYWNVIEGDSIWIPGKRFLGELGFNVLIKYHQTFNDNVSIFSNLNLYNNYMDVNPDNRWNIDVDWETGIRFTISKYISTVINVHLIYDDNVKFEIDGREKPILQFKESIGISFLNKFSLDNKNKKINN